MEGWGGNGREEKECELENKWMKMVDREHMSFHREKIKPDPSLDAKFKRRSNECQCEKLKQKRHDKQCVNYLQGGSEEVEYHQWY